MKNPLKNSLLFFLVFPLVAFSQSSEEPWLLSWPIYQSMSGAYSLLNGYGDWCVIDEGPHPGLDVTALPLDFVLVPTDLQMFSLGAKDFGDINGGAAIVFSPSIEGTPPYWGWGMLHLKITDPTIWPFAHGSAVNGRQPLAPCLEYEWEPGVYAPLHTHIAWAKCDLENENIVPVGPFHGYYNPFNYFVGNELDDFDEVQFKETTFSPWPGTGVWLMPDGAESAAQIALLTDYYYFQSVVSGAIDIAVSPFSAFSGLSNRDSSGVYSVAYSMLKQNPHTLEYDFAEPPGIGNYLERTLMEMYGDLPYGDSNAYRNLFLDGNVLTGVSQEAGTPGDNSYIVTNSSAIPVDQWVSGWDNIYTTSGYTNDWEGGICQGAWDTFLAKPNISGNPATNLEAFFPDGRYAVEVSAVSHGSRHDSSMVLPVNDLASLDPEVEGVIVDNFLPHASAVFVFTNGSNPIKYDARWVRDGSDIDSSLLAYLDELRTDLHFFQMLEQGVHVEASFPVESFMQYSSSETLASPASENLFVSEDNVPDGENPISFLEEEIARVEEELDAPQFGRHLNSAGYGYLPIDVSDSYWLKMLVFYSEPTAVENSTGVPLSDDVWMKGTVYHQTLWDSRNTGSFDRSSPATSASYVEYFQEELGSSFPAEVIPENAVLYSYVGNLPNAFSGSLQVRIGLSQATPTTGPRDLAGHLMDLNPATIAFTRQGYESWENLTPGSLYGYDSIEKKQLEWGIPCWWRVESLLYAKVGMDIVAEVDLGSIGLEGASFHGSCFPRYGAWMYLDEVGETGFDVPVVLYDGSVLNHNIQTKYPCGISSADDPYWYGNIDLNRVISPDGRYFWMAGSENNMNIEVSSAHAYCVDSESGSARSFFLCSGWCSGNSEINMEFYGSFAVIKKIYKTGDALVAYSYHTFGSPDPIIDYRVLRVSGLASNADIEESIPSSVTGNSSDLFAVSVQLLNIPVDSSIELIIPAAVWSISIFDLVGRRVLSESGLSSNSQNHLSFSTLDIPSGVYLLRYTVDREETVRSISIVH